MAIATNDNGTPMITLANLEEATRHEMRKFVRHHDISVGDSKAETLRAAIEAHFAPTPVAEPVAEKADSDEVAALKAELAALKAKVNSQQSTPAKGVSATMVLRAERTLRIAENGDYGAVLAGDTLLLTADALLAGGWSTAYCHLPNGWGRTKPAGMAFAACGWRYKGRTVLEGEVLATGKGDRTPHMVELVRIEAPTTGE